MHKHLLRSYSIVTDHTCGSSLKLVDLPLILILPLVTDLPKDLVSFTSICKVYTKASFSLLHKHTETAQVLMTERILNCVETWWQGGHLLKHGDQYIKINGERNHQNLNTILSCYYSTLTKLTSPLPDQPTKHHSLTKQQ